MIDAEKLVNGEFNPDNTENLCFPTTPIYKLVLLSIITLGFYNIIWCYKLWKTIKINFGYNVNPLLRAIFITLTNFSLFNILDKYFKKYGVKSFPPILFASVYFISPALDNIYKHHFIYENYLFYTFVPVIIIAIIQNRINNTNKLYFPFASNNNWNPINTVFFIIFTGLLSILFINP